MKAILSTVLFFLIHHSAISQSDSSYDLLIARAGLFHLQKDYKGAIDCYEKAFAVHQPAAPDAYKAAGAYALDSNSGKAFDYLQSALQNGWTESDWLMADPYFDFLRTSVPDQWKQVEKIALLKESQYEKTLKLPVLRKEINRMTLKDQQLRYKRIQLKDRASIRAINREIKISDSVNMLRVKNILQQYGWPKLSDIGPDGQNNLWLIVQHSDHDILFQQYALDEMEKLKKTKELRPDNYAFLYDRIQCNLNYKQLYGTQVTWTHNGKASGFRPILKEDGADERRKKLGLQPLYIYAASYGFTYNNKTDSEAKHNDMNDITATRNLMDSAHLYYKLKSFDKVYEFYNSASEIPGGMNDRDNYKAAILFCKIAALNNEQKYRDIALDFLNLQYLRRTLTQRKLNAEPAFRILHTEERWLKIYKEVK